MPRNRIADLWCRKMHTEAMWPIHGRYVCRHCLREHAVEWENRAPFQRESLLPSAETAPDVGIEIRIGLERYLQESFATFSLRARSNGSSISGGNGWLDLNSS